MFHLYQTYILKNDNKESRQYYIDNNSIFGNDYEIKLKNEMTQDLFQRNVHNGFEIKLKLNLLNLLMKHNHV